MKFKFNFKKRIKIGNSVYNEEIKEEIKNNSILLSFALAIIIVGIISIFYNNSDTLLIGIAVSSLLLTLIQCFISGNTIFNIFPIITLLIFGFFPKTIENIPIVNILMRKELCNLIVFLTFGLMFFTQACENIVHRHNVKIASINYNREKNKMLTSELNIIKNIKDGIQKIKKTCKESGIKDKNLNKTLNELAEYIEKESFVSNVKSSLIVKGNEDKKNTFNIEEVEESLLLNNAVIRNRKINAIILTGDEEE